MIPVVCALIEDKLGRLLIAKRPERKCLGGLCEFLGGKFENGESPELALRRELREELDPVEHHYENFSLRLIPCRAKSSLGFLIPQSIPRLHGTTRIKLM